MFEDRFISPLVSQEEDGFNTGDSEESKEESEKEESEKEESEEEEM